MFLECAVCNTVDRPGCAYVVVWPDFEVVVRVRCGMRVISHWCPVQYTKIAMTAVRSRPFYVWNGVVLATGEQGVRLCLNLIRLLALDASWIWSYYHLLSMRYELVILPGCAVQTNYNGDDGCALTFAECMKNRRFWRTDRTFFVLVCAWIWNCYSCSMQYEVVISFSFCYIKYHNWTVFGFLFDLSDQRLTHTIPKDSENTTRHSNTKGLAVWMNTVWMQYVSLWDVV